MIKHQKHTKLIRANSGRFNALEFSIHGTTCKKIQRLAKHIIDVLGMHYKIGYIDSSHNPEASTAMEAKGAKIYCTDHQDHFEWREYANLNQFDFAEKFKQMDLVLANGNHHFADAQILVIDPVKEESNKRKLDKFQQVKLVLLSDCVSKVPAYIEDAIPEIKSKPVYAIDQIEKIVHFLAEEIKQNIPPLQGLVLAGGKSQRMGQDKAWMEFHKTPQYLHAVKQISPHCESVHISCREGQQDLFPRHDSFIIDSFLNLGPFGAILSAFRENPNRAYLVVACDLPLLDNETINKLVKNRNPSHYATAFIHPKTGFPEPLISIWEPKSYSKLLHFLSLGYSCPRKVLINSEITQLEALNDMPFTNVNNPEDAEKVATLLQKEEKNGEHF